MTAAIDYPTLRLIRTSIGEWSLQGLVLNQPAWHVEVLGLIGVALYTTPISN